MTDPATHTITITEVSAWGVAYDLVCDDQAACHKDDDGACALRTWWEEIGIELVEGTIDGPPPWRCTTEWFIDEYPRLVKAP